MTTYSRDVFYCGKKLTDGADAPDGNVLVVSEGATPFTLELDAGIYYPHDSQTLHDAGFKGLFYAIRKLLNDGTTSGVGTLTGGTPTNTYSWAVITPTGSTGQTGAGVQLRADGAASAWSVDWTDAATTLNAQHLGSILAEPISDDSSTLDSGDQIFSWPNVALMRLVTKNIGDHHATDKSRDPYKMTKRSDPRPGFGTTLKWGSGFYRKFLYQDCYPADVEEQRAGEASFASQTGRNTNDLGGTWFKVWDTLTDGIDVIVSHNTGDGDDGFDPTSGTYEVIRLAPADLKWEGQFNSQTRRQGDYRDIAFKAWVDPDNSNYKH